jgi:hypothetical protein
MSVCCGTPLRELNGAAQTSAPATVGPGSFAVIRCFLFCACIRPSCLRAPRVSGVLLGASLVLGLLTPDRVREYAGSKVLQNAGATHGIGQFPVHVQPAFMFAMSVATAAALKGWPKAICRNILRSEFPDPNRYPKPSPALLLRKKVGRIFEEGLGFFLRDDVAWISEPKVTKSAHHPTATFLGKLRTSMRQR